MADARLEDATYVLEAPRPVGELSSFLDGIGQHARRHGPCLVGFDFPIGVPTAYAGHIAVATVHQVDYLVTWNCVHIANAEILPRVAAICRMLGFGTPFVCTPDELLGDEET